jgi:hypothetical protein
MTSLYGRNFVCEEIMHIYIELVILVHSHHEGDINVPSSLLALLKSAAPTLLLRIVQSNFLAMKMQNSF